MTYVATRELADGRTVRAFVSQSRAGSHSWRTEMNDVELNRGTGTEDASQEEAEYRVDLAYAEVRSYAD